MRTNFVFSLSICLIFFSISLFSPSPSLPLTSVASSPSFPSTRPCWLHKKQVDLIACYDIDGPQTVIPKHTPCSHKAIKTHKMSCTNQTTVFLKGEAGLISSFGQLFPSVVVAGASTQLTSVYLCDLCLISSQIIYAGKETLQRL